MEEPAAAATLRERLAAAGVDLVCPACKGPLVDAAAAPDHPMGAEAAFRCGRCERSYPVVAGIPDFRLQPDRFIGLDADRRKGLRALEIARDHGGGFEAALDAYWSITPELAVPIAARHRQRQAVESEIGEQTLDEGKRMASARATGVGEAESVLLDLGCATGGLLLAAARRFRLAVGIDVAFRWLLIGRLRLREAGVDPPLVCANAEHLPFAGSAFDLVLASDLVEHVVDPAAVLKECRRAISRAGTCYLATNNRYSLAPEPHVHLWGVGFLPEGLQKAYVRALRNHSYENVRLLSGGALVRLAAQAGFQRPLIEPAPLYARHLGEKMDRLVQAYNSRRLDLPYRPVLARLAPRIQALLRPRSA